MRYMLKSGLTKATIYETVKEHLPSGIVLPSSRKCHIKKCRNSYYLSFGTCTYGCKFSFFQFAGLAQLRITCWDYLDDEDRVRYTKYPMISVPFSYLLDHGMLWEVG